MTVYASGDSGKLHLFYEPKEGKALHLGTVQRYKGITGFVSKTLANIFTSRVQKLQINGKVYHVTTNSLKDLTETVKENLTSSGYERGNTETDITKTKQWLLQVVQEKPEVFSSASSATFSKKKMAKLKKKMGRALTDQNKKEMTKLVRKGVSPQDFVIVREHRSAIGMISKLAKSIIGYVPFTKDDETINAYDWASENNSTELNQVYNKYTSE